MPGRLYPVSLAGLGAGTGAARKFLKTGTAAGAGAGAICISRVCGVMVQVLQLLVVSLGPGDFFVEIVAVDGVHLRKDLLFFNKKVSFFGEYRQTQ